SHALGGFIGTGDNGMDHMLNNLLGQDVNKKDTQIKTIVVPFLYHDQVVSMSDSFIQTDLLELAFKGTVDRGLNTDLETWLYINKDISVRMVKGLDGFRRLMDDHQRIAIEASLKGKAPHLKYKPSKDFRKKAKKALMQEGGNLLGILLGGAVS
ncbi:MAG: hypothetical protein HQL13_07310, partial [Candidatus Omnitrophica bacterium]|nr:hypothetical protein [Candidatus Omnitrophota bacterium]